jgi:16S rRNA (guanine(966)-N(2))-methyltransferase RsmD
MATRPTSDRLRETLFNVLAQRIEGARFLDLFAGSGAVGIEAVSRGAERVVVVERAQAALKVLRGNLESLGLRSRVRVESLSVAAFLKKVRPHSVGFTFDVIFMDPPYEAEDEYALALGLLGGEASGLLALHAAVIAEHRRKHKLEDRYGLLERTRLLEQGDAALSFYRTAIS